MAPAYKVYAGRATRTWLQHLKGCERLHPAALRGSQIGRSNEMGTPVVLITGALTGIGRAAVLAFAREGNRIVVAGRHETAGQELAAELRAVGTEAEFFRTDVRHEDEVRNLVDRTVARFGSPGRSGHNAGTEGRPGPVTQQTADTYTATFDTNVLGTLLSMKHELRVMQAQGSGSIVNISSTYGHEGGAGASVYVASKHAVEGMTKSAALEAAHFGVRVNAVAPVVAFYGTLREGALDLKLRQLAYVKASQINGCNY